MLHYVQQLVCGCLSLAGSAVCQSFLLETNLMKKLNQNNELEDAKTLLVHHYVQTLSHYTYSHFTVHVELRFGLGHSAALVTLQMPKTLIRLIKGTSLAP